MVKNKISKKSNRNRLKSKRSNRKSLQRNKRSNRNRLKKSKRLKRRTNKKGGMFKSKKSSLQSILDKQDRETVALISKKRAEHSRSEREGKHSNIPLHVWNLIDDDKFKLFYNQCNKYFTITNDMSSRGFFLELKNQSNNLANVHYHIFVDEESVYPKIQLTSRCPDEEPSGECEDGIRQSSGKIWKHGCHLLVKNAIAGDYTKRWKWDLHFLLGNYWRSWAEKGKELNNLFELLQNLLLKANDICNEVCTTTFCDGVYK